MSVAPHAGVIDFGTFTPPTVSLDGIQGEVPQPLIGQENYVLTGNGWSSLGALGTITYQGTWDASTNTPTLTSSVGTQGYYYVVSVAGTTDLNGITTWDVGDWVIFNGSTWQKIEGGSTGTFTNVITPQVTARTDNLTLSAISTGAVNLNTAGGTQFKAINRASADIFVQAQGGVGGVSRPSFGAVLAGASAAGFNIYNSGGQPIRFQTNGSGGNDEQFIIAHTASTVNSIQITGAATGNTPAISAQGSDANINLLLNPKGTGQLNVFINNGSQFRVSNTASAVNYLQVAGGPAGSTWPSLSVQGSDTDVGVELNTKGTGSFRFNTGANLQQFRITNTTSAVNYVQVTGSSTGAGVTLSAQGSDSAISWNILAKGNSAINFRDGSSSLGFSIDNSAIASGVASNYIQVARAGTGNAASVKTAGTDTNIALALQSKGTGAIDLAAGSSGINISNGGTVTAYTRTASGSGYTSIPTTTISLPTTAGGVQATAYSVIQNSAATIANGGTGYTVGDVLTMVGGTIQSGSAGTFTVSTVSSGVITAVTANNFGQYSAIPTNPVSVTGGTGSSATLNVSYIYGYPVSINVGSGYVEQPTVTITGGGGSGAAAYATVGSDTAVRSLGTNMNFYASNQNIAFRVYDSFGAGNGYWAAQGGATNPFLWARGGANTQGGITSSGTGGVTFYTNSGNNLQFAVSHAASAVNWVQVTGGATGADPVISAQGSDAARNLRLTPKGTGQVLSTSSFIASSASANYIQLSGGATTGFATQTQSLGSDTNISMAFQPKGTGAIDLAAGSSGVNISNGGTVTAITRTASGATPYTSIPSCVIAAPTTAGGVQATVSLTMAAYSGTAVTPAVGGTGYTLNDVLTLVGGTFTQVAQFIVTGVSSGVVTQVTRSNTNFGVYSVLPSSIAATTGGTGTGCTLNTRWEVLPPTITNAGSGYIEQPTVTFSGGGGSGAAAYASVGSTPVIKSLAGTLSFNNSAGEALRLNNVNFSTLTDYVEIRGGASVAGAYLTVGGSTTNASLYTSSKGTNQIGFYTNSFSQEQMRIAHTASAVNYLQVTGAVTSGTPTISAQGSDASIPLQLRSKGNFNISLNNGAGNNGLVVNLTSGTTLANYVEVAPKIAGQSPTISSLGSDTNISLNLVTKGTGTVQQNGNPLAQVNHKYHAFAVGSYWYDSYNQDNYLRLFTENATSDTIRYAPVSSPEYYDYGTSTWTAWAAGLSGIQQLLDGNPSSGIDVAHANRTFRFIVNNNDGYPTNALVLLQSTWSAVTYTTATVTIASSTTIGGTYTTRQVMVFSPANTGNNWGMHAYYTGSIHTGDRFYQITIDLTDWVDNTTYVTYPLRNLCILSNYSNAGNINPYTTSYNKWANFIGGINTPSDVNGGLSIGRYSSANPSAIIDTGSNATSIQFRTQYIPQLLVTHTSSAVNWVQATGATTTNPPIISAQGSDSNISLRLDSKGSGAITFVTSGALQAAITNTTSAVNYVGLTGGATGNPVTVFAGGNNTDIDLSLTPKGTGNVRFGTYTGTILTPTGYIEVKDSSGTIRRLLVG